jgi:hypothetical protein
VVEVQVKLWELIGPMIIFGSQAMNLNNNKFQKFEADYMKINTLEIDPLITRFLSLSEKKLGK